MGTTNSVSAQDLLEPISKERPSGDSPIGRELLGQLDELLGTGQWPRVIDLSTTYLRTAGKDLEACRALTFALTQTDGFAGANSGLSVLLGVMQHYWDLGLHPIDLEDRGRSLRWLNSKFAGILRNVPLTIPASGRDSYSFSQHREALEIQKNSQDEEYVRKKLKEGWISIKKWEDAVRETPPDFYASTKDTVGRIRLALGAIDTFLRDKLKKSSPKLDEVDALLGELYALVEAIDLPNANAPRKPAESQPPSSSGSAANPSRQPVEAAAW